MLKWTGKPLASLRADANMPQRILAEKVDLSNSMISGFEHDTKTPSVETVMQFAEIFQVSTDYLLGLTDLKTMPALLKKEFVQGLSYNDVLQMIDALTMEQREALLIIARDMKFVTDVCTR